MESTSHVTLATAFPVTVAVNVCDCPVVRATRTGLIATDAEPPPPAAVMVIVAEAVFVPSATDIAVTATAAGVGRFAGAVYVTVAPAAADRVPQAAPLQPAPVRVQCTPLFCESF